MEEHDQREPFEQRWAGEQRHPAVEDGQAPTDHRLRNQPVGDRPLRRPVLGRVSAAVPDPAVVGRSKREPRDDAELREHERRE